MEEGKVKPDEARKSRTMVAATRPTKKPRTSMPNSVLTISEIFISRIICGTKLD
jgi:hypothetical protein